MHDDHPTASHPPPEPPQAQRRLARRATLINGIAVLFLFGAALPKH